MPNINLSPRQRKYRQVGKKTRAFLRLILLVLEILRRVFELFS